MNIIEKYLAEAVEAEAEFLRSRDKKEIHSFHKDIVDGQITYTVPSEVMFPNDAKIVVKAPLSPFLLNTYFQKDSSFIPQLPVNNQFYFFHKHNFFEFNYVYHGKVENHLQDSNIMQTPEQLLLMNPHAAHHSQIIEEDTIYFNILVNRQWAEEIFTHLLSFHKGLFNFLLDSVYGLNRVSPYILFENTPELNLLICEMIAEYYRNDIYSQQMLFAKLFQLFIILSRKTESTVKDKTKTFSKKSYVSEILSYLKLNYATVNLKETAEHFGYTPDYLSRLIKKHTGRNYSDIIESYKLESACNYLINSNLSTEKIVEIIGYYDYSYFSKKFQKKYGKTPSKYRKENQLD